MRHKEQFPRFGIPPATTEHIRRQLQEAPPGLFRPTIVPCLNTLAGEYLKWLESSDGVDFCSNVVGIKRALKLKKSKINTTEDYLGEW